MREAGAGSGMALALPALRAAIGAHHAVGILNDSADIFIAHGAEHALSDAAVFHQQVEIGCPGIFADLFGILGYKLALGQRRVGSGGAVNAYTFLAVSLVSVGVSP